MSSKNDGREITNSDAVADFGTANEINDAGVTEVSRNVLSEEYEYSRFRKFDSGSS